MHLSHDGIAEALVYLALEDKSQWIEAVKKELSLHLTVVLDLPSAALSSVCLVLLLPWLLHPPIVVDCIPNRFLPVKTYNISPLISQPFLLANNALLLCHFC